MKITEEMIPEIEKAMGLGFKLYDHQKSYLLGESVTMPTGRANGKTVAFCIKLALSEGPPLDARKPEEYSDMQHFSKGDLIQYARNFFRHEFMDIRFALKGAGFTVREMKF